jgi:glycosyltransferase involved in cell wall biosynthesis
MLVKNEAGRWLRQVCSILQEVSDCFIVLDDGSSDGTVNICKEYTELKNIYVNKESLWETNEVQRRKELFNLCMEQSSNEKDWIMIIDADEIICNHKELRYVMLNNVPDIRTDVFTFKLYDMWNNDYYRDDNWWVAHNNNWHMAFRARKNNYIWNEQTLHCGRFPKNIGTSAYISNFKIKHMGWSTPEDRKRKYKRYMRIDQNGKYGILEQYLSILDENPRLVKFDD